MAVSDWDFAAWNDAVASIVDDGGGNQVMRLQVGNYKKYHVMYKNKTDFEDGEVRFSAKSEDTGKKWIDAVFRADDLAITNAYVLSLDVSGTTWVARFYRISSGSRQLIGGGNSISLATNTWKQFRAKIWDVKTLPHLVRGTLEYWDEGTEAWILIQQIDDLTPHLFGASGRNGFGAESDAVTASINCRIDDVIISYTVYVSNTTIISTDIINEGEVHPDTEIDFQGSADNDPTSWLWDFGDGNTSAQQNPSYTYSSCGVYVVTLTAIDEGSSDSTTFVVNVVCCGTIHFYIPFYCTGVG